MSKNLKERRLKDLSHLVRMDADRVHGWQLRVPKWHIDGPATQLFSDANYGGDAQALAAARARRNELFAKQGAPTRPTVHDANARNTSGVVGVSFSRDLSDEERPHFYWCAYWSPPGKGQVRRSFSVKRYGYLEAWGRALELRQSKTGVHLSDFELAQARLHCLEMWPHYIQALRPGDLA